MNWYLVRTKPHGEKVAELNLHRLGVESFCPQLKLQKIIRRKHQMVISPLFPGYLFARFDERTHYRTVHYATGVRGVVTFGTTLAQVENSIIDAIKTRIHQGYVKVTSSSSFKPGERVRIQEGPFQGLEAVFEREMSDRQRVALLLKAVAYQARIVVRADQVTTL